MMKFGFFPALATALSFLLVFTDGFTDSGKRQTGGESEECNTMNSNHQVDLGAVFDAHVAHEFVDQDVDATMRTMTAEPYVHNVVTAKGGYGGDGVRRYYTEEFVGKMPKDTQVIPISRTVGKDQVVDELILTFTHDIPIESMLPGVPPTGRFVELPHVVVMKFEDGKIAHEHIYWDQASLLVQVGLLDPERVPATGAEQARKLVELTQP
jgi:carboxymethylenebutenolidase